MSLTPPLKVIIVDDMVAIREDIEFLLQQYPDFTVAGVCGSVYDALIMIPNIKPDLLLLDIRLPDGTGFDILEQLSTPSNVIFITAHDEHTITAIRCRALDYLLKPINENEFKAALKRVIDAQPLLPEPINIDVNSMKKKGQDHIQLQSQGFLRNVKFKEITYLQGDYGHTTVFLHDGRKLVTTANLSEYEKQLPDTTFLRVHQSYLVNQSYIDRYQQKEGIIYLKDATPVQVAARKKKWVARFFKKL